MHEALKVTEIVLSFIEKFFLLYIIIYSTYLFLSAVFGSVTLYRNRYNNLMSNEVKNDYYMPISILVPAYNEELTAIDTVESLLNLDYKLYEIIVVNDGSKDRTSEVLIEHFNMVEIERPIRRKVPSKDVISVYEAIDYKVSITLINKNNGGKSDALNMGINASNFPYFIALDADSLLQRDSLEQIVKPFLESDEVIVTGGLIRLSNGATIENGEVTDYKVPNHPLLSMQVLEYDRSFLASRIMFDYYNGNLIVSGAFGLFKKDIVISAGGYDRNTVGEDFELILKLHNFCRIHNIKYKIKYVADAVCWTQAPNTLKVLMKQRKRWFLGLYQNMKKYRKMFFNYKFGLISFFSYFYYLVYELLTPYIEIFGIAAIIAAFALDLLNLHFMLIFFGIYALFGGILSLTTFLARIHILKLKISFSDFIKASYSAIAEIIILRSILNISRLTAFFGYKKKKHVWDTKRYVNTTKK